MTTMLEYFAVENTGWTNGTSWFKTGGSDMHPLRFKTFDEASDYAKEKKARSKDPSILWRVVKTTVELHETKRIVTDEWIPV